MSKYIRLKDKIVKVEAEDSECYYFNKLKKFVYKDEGYKTADTIEELIDEFVATRGHTGDYVHYAKSIFKEETIKDFLEQDFEIYGAIWTEWGLKYVAKMNLGGKLEDVFSEEKD